MSTPWNIDDDGKKWVKDTLASLTVTEKIGQVLAPMFTRDSDDGEGLPAWAEKYGLGGGHLFGGTYEEMRDLTDAVNAVQRVPMLFTGDLDRCGDRIREGTVFPSQMALSAAGSEDLAYALGKAIATENKAAGFHWTFSPIIDLCGVQDHLRLIASLGEDPETVARLAIAQIRGLQEHGLAACAKHFPGDGFDDRDQHLTTSINPLSRKEWFKRSGYTFKKCIDAGVWTIMNSCIACPGLDPDAGDPRFPRPAAISKALTTDLLRGELGFEGVIITDALNMGGVTHHAPQPERYIQSFKAGNDMLLFVTRLEGTVKGMLEAVESGRITEARLDDSVTRILSLKAALGMHKQSNPVSKDDGLQLFSDSPFKKDARAVAEKSITLIRDTNNVLPVAKNKRVAHVLVTNRENEFTAAVFEQALKDAGCELTRFLNPGPEPMYDEVASGNYDVLITSLCFPIQWGFATPRCHGPYIRSVMSGYEHAHPEVVPVYVSWDSPLHLYELAYMDPFLVTYGSAPVAQEAAAKAILGEIPIQGRVPVSLEGFYKAGEGIEIKG